MPKSNPRKPLRHPAPVKSAATPAPRTPTYRLHKPTGNAVVTLNGRDVYLGPHGAPESRRAYDRTIAEWLQNHRRPVAANDGGATVATLVNAFRLHAEAAYPDAGGGQQVNYREACKPLVKLYADVPAADFGPLALQAVRAEMVGRGWCRTHVNRQIVRVKHVFKWGVSKELVPPAVLAALQAVDGLRAGRCVARESEPVKPVPVATVRQTLDFLPPTVAAMVTVQLHTGMRPGELCAMRPCDLDTAGPTWTYAPPVHKNAHRGQGRTVFIGPEAQRAIRPHLTADLAAPIFSPATAEAERLATRHAARKTPAKEGNRPGSNRVSNPRRAPGDRYAVAAYRRAIEYACDRAFPAPAGLNVAELKSWRRRHRWHPHQLRHTAATELNRRYGVQVAQTVLGHRTLAATAIYAEPNLDAARAAMAEAG